MLRNRTDRLLSTLAARPLQCDGATGTQLQQLGLRPGESCERWVIEQPDRVKLVHQRYLDAGADLLTTNTFGGTTLALAAHGFTDEARAAEINRAAARLAREVAGERAWVLGDMGPFGGILEPYGETESAVAAAAFRAQAAALLEGGADAILVETMSDPVEAALAVAAAREAGAQVVIATFTFQHMAAVADFRTMMGTDVPAAVRAVLDAGAQVVGANCGTELSLDDYALLAGQLVAAAQGRPVIVQPNAGSPVRDGDAISYRTTPADFAGAAACYLKLGVRIVGGCCGTTPAHIAASAAMNRQAAA
ncbi:homocysteine S-methyltransferase family protein [Geminisphaera colitermitum]|uniref:homocysteine S-methyltransferase family protein n=1 Tax=Geminisphaera colitermitum TaxID=1148786 RepID=UPI000196552D|nr:homocysteine S-methyltransferase family protein [Geminisphaera colitermitum]